jgi:mono/diheme cytochrome c family protein
MHQITLVIFLSVMALATARADAKPDFAHGRQLHAARCTGCHGAMTGGDGTTLYTREQRLINSKGELTAQVRHYQSELKLNWSNADITDVAHYLNQRYYQFGQ